MGPPRKGLMHNTFNGQINRSVGPMTNNKVPFGHQGHHIGAQSIQLFEKNAS